jgi:hypothetical protein
MVIYVLRPWDAPIGYSVNVTSNGTDIGARFSPFTLGPCGLYANYRALNMENAWQYSKVYYQHDAGGIPNSSYYHWAVEGWNNSRAVRYPMGKGVVPQYSWWDGEALGYIAARKLIYIPLYASMIGSYRMQELVQLWRLAHASNYDLTLHDYDAYDHRKLGMTWIDVVNCETRKMGHGFVLAMMLEGLINTTGEHIF